MTQAAFPAASSCPLEAVLAERGALPVEEALPILRQLLVQVRALHASGRTHRAIGLPTVHLDAAGCATLTSPEPVRELDGSEADGESCPPELHGLGAVRLPAEIEAARRELERAGVALDPRRIDVYQLGALLCRLLTGQAVSAYLCSPKTKSKVPPSLQPLIDRALGHNPAERFADCDAYAAALEAVGREAPTAALETPPGGSAIAAPSNTPAGGADSPSGPSQPPSRELPFARLGHYRIYRRIGHGGMGDVYLGYEEALNRKVAIKVLPAELTRSEDFVRRFRAEATAAARVTHPNIVPIYFIGQDAGFHFFAMRYVAGESLDRRLARCGHLGVDETLAVLEQCLAGLGAAHRAGLVHRDVKPGNVLLEADSGRALVADFGLVKVASAHSGVTATGVVMGTVDYIPPEQARAEEVDGRSDLYSVGVMAYRMLSGRLPFEAKTPTAMLFQHAYETPKPLGEAAPDVPQALAALVDKLMAKDPAARCQTCEAAAADVRRFRADAQAVSVAPRPSQIVQAPDFGRPPQLDAGVERLASGNWWRRVRDRAADLFQAHAPEFVKELQSTTQQVDGALAEHQRRRDRLAHLVVEAQQAIEELAAQAKSHREAAAAAARRADAASGEEAAHQAAKAKEECERIAAELERQVAEQRGQLEPMRSNLVQADATLGRLRIQRDLLKARLRAAEARLNLKGGRRRPLALVACALVLLAAVVGLVLLVSGGLYFALSPSRPQVKSPGGEPDATVTPPPPAPPPPLTKLLPPDIYKGTVLYHDEFDDPSSGFGKFDIPERLGGRYDAGKYLLWVHGGNGRVGKDRGDTYADFACRLVGRVAGPPSGRWGVYLSNPTTGYGIAVTVDGNGHVTVGPAPWEKEPARGPQIGPIAHPALARGDRFNTLLIVVRGRRVEVYVNSTAACDPITVDRDICPAVVGLCAMSAADEARAEFKSLTVWSANGVPTPDVGAGPVNAISPIAPKPAAVADIQIRQRVRLLGTPLVYQAAVSPDGQLFAADLDYGHGVTSIVWDGQTGQELHRVTGWLPGFTSDGKRFLVDDGGVQVYDIATWTRGLKVNHEGGWGYRMLPGGRHVMYWTAQHKMYLDDVEGGKVLQSWPYLAEDVNFAATDDGNVLLVKPAGEKSFHAWDLQMNKQIDAFAAIANYDRICWFLPGNKQAAVLDGGKSRLVNVVDGQRVGSLPELPGSGLQASSQRHLGGRIALQGYDDGKLRLFDAETGKERASFSLPDGERAGPRATIFLSPDARHACVASNHSVYLLRLPDPPADKPGEAP